MGYNSIAKVNSESKRRSGRADLSAISGEFGLTQYCMVYGIHKGGRGESVCCEMGVQ